jgi:hypothetical protein
MNDKLLLFIIYPILDIVITAENGPTHRLIFLLPGISGQISALFKKDIM